MSKQSLSQLVLVALGALSACHAPSSAAAPRTAAWSTLSNHGSPESPFALAWTQSPGPDAETLRLRVQLSAHFTGTLPVLGTLRNPVPGAQVLGPRSFRWDPHTEGQPRYEWLVSKALLPQLVLELRTENGAIFQRDQPIDPPHTAQPGPLPLSPHALRYPGHTLGRPIEMSSAPARSSPTP